MREAAERTGMPGLLYKLLDSIRWDGRGEGLLIDQPLFEAELLSPLR